MPAQGGRWSLLAALALTLALSGVAASAGEYRVEIEAPAPFQALLRENLDLARLSASPDLTEEQFQRLFAAADSQARDLMATEGYFSPVIATDLSQQDGITIAHLQVTPGKPAQVESVDIRFTGGITGDRFDFPARREAVRRNWSLKPGQRFRQAEWTAAKDAALAYVLEEWFPAAHIESSEARVDPEAGTVKLSLVIASGPPFTMGSLEITGLDRYPQETVTNLNRIAPGTPYSLKRLNSLQNELLGTGYFSSVLVTTEADPLQPENVPIRVNVIEHPQNKVRLGAGYSTDLGASGEVTYEYKDFLDRGWRFLAGALVAQREQDLGFGLVFPERKSGYRDTASILLRRSDIQGEITSSVGLGLEVAKIEENRDSIFSGDFIYERKEIESVSAADTLKSLVFNYSWVQRRVDSLSNPRKGYLVNLQAGGAVQGLLTDQGFARGYGRLALYWPVGERDRILLRGEAGAISAGETAGIPSKYLFRTGGSQSVRGYEFDSLGPQVAGATVGGKYLAVASAEYLHMFTPEWGGVVFIDAGNATDEWDNFSAAVGYGAGVRWASPVGPVGLDIAYGRDDEAYRIHFAIGFRF